MSTLREHIERFELVDMIASWNEEPKCESPGHEAISPFGPRDVCHGEVTHWVKSPCGHGGLRCAQRVALIKSYTAAYCGYCGGVASGDEFVFIEL